MKKNAAIFTAVFVTILVVCSVIEQVTYPQYVENDMVTKDSIGKLPINQKVALLFNAVAAPMRTELDTWPYFTVNDMPIHPAAYLDNTSSRQYCLAKVTAAGVRGMSGMMTRGGGSGNQNKKTQVAADKLNSELHPWGLFGIQTDEPERKINDALGLIDSYFEEMANTEEQVVNFDNHILRKLVARAKDVRTGDGIVDRAYNRLVDESPDNNFTNVDERFYCGQAGARVMHAFLYALINIFPEEARFHGKQMHLEKAIYWFKKAANYNPIIVLESTKEIYLMEHYYTAGFRALEWFLSEEN